MRNSALARTATAITLTAMVASACVQLAPVGSPGSTPTAVGALPSGAAVVTQGPAAEPTKRPRRPRRSPTPPAPTASAQPTATLAPTDSVAPTDAATASPTAPTGTPTGTRTLPSLIIDLPSFILEPIDPPELDYTLAPNYGTASLTGGFTPDPYSLGMTAGGSVNVSYLGSSCVGYATEAPDLRINLSGSSALLRIYFVAATADTTLVVNDPFGNFYCVDDSFGTLNPTIDFNNPAGGSYDLWVGSYASSTPVAGTLYVTANSGNHP